MGAKLLQPIQIRSLTLHNRLVMPPMATAKADPDGLVTPDIISYYDEKTRAGAIGLVIVEHSFVHPFGKSSPIQLSVAADDCDAGLRTLAETIHRNGSKAAMQLNHAGAAAPFVVTGREPAGPSGLAHPVSGQTARELTGQEISQIIKSFADAARRTRQAGFDAVEIHSAHGYLLNQFYSPLGNQRQDIYGGSLTNRIRLHLEIVDAVRDAVGDMPILLRLGAVDYLEGGSTIEDAVIASQAFAAAGIDLLDISGGFAGFNISGLEGQGFFAPVSSAIRKAVSVPVLLTGGVTEAKAAEQLLRDGAADLIGVGRALLKDSEWAVKAVASLKNKA